MRRRSRRLGFGVASCALAAACGKIDAGSTANSATSPLDVIFAASDYNKSTDIGGLTLNGKGTEHSGSGNDPALAVSRGRFFFIDRYDSSVNEIDPTTASPTGLSFNVDDPTSTTGSPNPQDLAVASDGTMWIPCYHDPILALIAPDGTFRKIDLSSYDSDGNPQASAIQITEVDGVEKAFVALERLTSEGMDLVPTQPSEMLRIDVATRTVEDVITLAGRNPFDLMPMSQSGALYLAEPGNFDKIDLSYSGIERFDTTTSTSAILVTEVALGGSVAEVSVSNDETCGAAIVAGPEANVNPTSVVTFDPKSGALITSASNPVLGPTAGFDLSGLAWVTEASGGEVLLVGDRRGVGGAYPVHEFDLGPKCTLTERPDVVFVHKAPVALRATHGTESSP